MKSYILSALLFLICPFPALMAQTADEARFEALLTDSASGEALGYAVCALRPKEGAGAERAAAADARGVCRIDGLSAGVYELHVSYMGYLFHKGEVRLAPGLTRRSIRLDIDPIRIAEVVVTAVESKGATSSSKIGRDAIAHIQPSSFADLLELIPGGRASDPAFGSPQTIHLRDAAPLSDGNYATASLGTQFQVDGVPISNDADLQATSGYLGMLGRSSNINRGVDMRTISVDDIASVEIVRGIPSVEYGDLTSGLVRIERRKGGRDLNARFKADMNGKLFSVGKGLEWSRPHEGRTTLNLGADYLISNADPRSPRDSYRRITASGRLGHDWQGRRYAYTFNANLDFTRSFDDKKSDTDLDTGSHGPIESYKSAYNRMQISSAFGLKARERSFFRGFDATASLTVQADRIDRWRIFEAGRDFAKAWGTVDGEYDALIVPSRYEATHAVDGKPFNAYVKAVAAFRVDAGESHHTLRVGADWSMDKNYGRGQLFDITRPFYEKQSTRPRPYDAIPALHKLSAFAEAASTFAFGDWRAEATVGVRSTAMLNLGSRYAVQGKPYFDPRANVTLSFPTLRAGGRNLVLRLSGGVGQHTKLPTMSQLFPETDYFDFTQLNYWSVEHPETYRRINMRLYTLDPTNYALHAARNLKWELRLDAEWNGNTLSVTYFSENMDSGFRSTSDFRSFTYKKYDPAYVKRCEDAGLPFPPLDEVPYETVKSLSGYGYTSNGSRTQKSGVEFSFTSQRIRPLATRMTVTGAYFRTFNSNSQPEYWVPSVSIGGSYYPYAGYYESTDGYLREMCNTNFLFDTQIPRLRLIFTTSFQCVWFMGSRNTPPSARPVSYIDNDLTVHPFTDASAADGILSALVRNSYLSLWQYVTTPFSMAINLKITKKIYRYKLSVAPFVNKLLDYTPDYRTSDGRLVRREVTPYFGMELNLKL